MVSVLRCFTMSGWYVAPSSEPAVGEAELFIFYCFSRFYFFCSTLVSLVYIVSIDSIACAALAAVVSVASFLSILLLVYAIFYC